MNIFEQAQHILVTGSIFNHVVRDQINIDHADSVVNNTVTIIHNYQHLLVPDVAKQVDDCLNRVMEVVGRERLDPLQEMIDIALKTWHQDRFKEAEGLMLQAFDLSERLLEKANPMVLEIMGYVVEIYKVCGKSQEAKNWTIEIENRKQRAKEEHQPIQNNQEKKS